VDAANHEITKALKQCRTLKGVNCSIKSEFFGVAWAAAQDKPRYSGTFTQSWKDKEKLEVVIKWEGWARGKSCDLATLLGNDEEGEPLNFRLEPYDNEDPAPVYDSEGPEWYEMPQAQTAGGGANGAGDSDPESDEDEEPELLEQVEVGDYTWKIHREPAAVKEDVRTEPRYAPKLIAAQQPKTIDEMFFHMLPSGWLELQLQYTNGLLHGNDAINKKLDKGELLQWWGYSLTLALHSGVTIEKMWSKEPLEETLLMPPALGRHGMTLNRWKKIRSALRFGPDGDTDFDSDAWCFVRPLVDEFNAHMASCMHPGWLLGDDESMCAWRGSEGLRSILKIPKKSWVPRKPEPLGAELKTTGDALSGVLLHVEIQEGKEAHDKHEFFKEFGHTTATTLRMNKAWFGSKRVVYGDSWFAGVKTAVQMLERGLHFMGDVKTNTKGFPVNALEEATGEERGAWAVLETKVTLTNGEERKLYAISHRRGGEVHKFISTCGTTLPGNAHVGTFEDEEEEGVPHVLERKCPKVLNDCTLAQPVIDRHNRYRQFILALEKRILTNSFSLRFGTTMHGMVFVNAFFGLRCFSMPVADFKPEMSKLAYRLMHNSLLVVDAGPSRSPGTPGSGPPNSPNSPAASESGRSSPGGCCGAHPLIPLKLLTNYRGGKQQRCVICGGRTALCCSICTKDCNHIVPICPRATKGRGNDKGKVFLHDCARVHEDDPTKRSARKGAKRSRCV
jgi:hypothetical protein